MLPEPFNETENRSRMQAGELYYAFTPELTIDRRKCRIACKKFSNADECSRRERIELWKEATCDSSPLPPAAASEKEDDALLEDYPLVSSPVKMDYGYNVKLGRNAYVGPNSTWIDTCTITVGSRTLIGPNCSFYSATHPLDPFLRDGLRGPEGGKPIVIGDDCWLGGNCIVLPGVTIGRGVTVGAGSVVTKDVPDFVCVAGNPAKLIRQIEVSEYSD